MKKILALILVMATLTCLFIMPTSAAYVDGEVIYSEDFNTTPTLDYTDPDGNYDVAFANGKLDLYCMAPSKLYKLPVEIKGLTKFTIVFDWEVYNTMDASNPGHTLYAAFGIKDADNGVYVGYSHVNGTEHIGTVDNGTFNRAYRTHYSEPSAEKTVGKTIDAVKDTKKIRIKIEVEDGVTRTYVNGKRELLNETEDWRDMDKVGTLTHDGYIGFTSRGTAFEALIDYIAVYAGVGITSIDDLPEPDAETSAVETTTAAPETTTAAPETTTAAPETTTAAPDTTTAAPTVETTTAAPTTNAPTTEAPKSEGGCGGFVALGIIACVIPAAVVILKKKD